MNNLRQMQYRKSLVWVKKTGRNVYYDRAEVEAYKEKRIKRNKMQYVGMTILADPEIVTIQEIDEALAHVRELLQDRYGNRLTHQKRTLLLESVDELLDVRLQLKAESYIQEAKWRSKRYRWEI